MYVIFVAFLNKKKCKKIKTLNVEKTCRERKSAFTCMIF